MQILIADDDEDARVALRAGAVAFPDIVIVGEAASADDALERVRAETPDGIVLDHHMADDPLPAPSARPGRRPLTTLQVIEFIRSLVPEATIAVFSSNDSIASSAVNAGADMFVPKSAGPATLFERMLSHYQGGAGS